MDKSRIQAAPLAGGFKLKGQGEDRIDLNRCSPDTTPGFFNEWTMPADPEPARLTFALGRTLSFPIDFDALAADDFFTPGSGNKARRRAASLGISLDAAWNAKNGLENWGHEPTAKGLFEDGWNAREEQVSTLLNSCDILRSEELRVTAELAKIKAALSNPESVFINMKTGAIAKPTLRSMVDLYGEVVNGDDAQLLEIARLRAENQILHDQVKVLQADPNSWQSGYDRGRELGGKHAQSERAQLKAENERLRAAPALSGVLVQVKTADLIGPALAWAVRQPNSDQPKTFGCHHMMPTCRQCEDMVRRWLVRELGETVEVPSEFIQP